MRRATVAVAAAGLLLAPTALAFFSGGYFPQPRLVAALALWALVLVGPLGVPRSRAGRVALAGLGLMTVWTAASLAWAPLAGPVVDATGRLLLYVAALLLAVGALRESAAARRALEPALAAGALVVIGYGMLERLLPGLVTYARSRSAFGRLDQPLTYWNAEGALAALGIVLCARLAGDRSRPPWLRAAAAAAVVPLAAGLYVTFSRGAIAVALIGLVALAALAPLRAQLRACVTTLGTGVLAAVACAPFAGVTALAGDAASRRTDGLVVLVLLAGLAAAAALETLRAGRTAGERAAAVPAWGRRIAPVATIAAVAAAALLVAGGLRERPTAAELSAGAQATRLTTVSSNRYEYWRVALRTFAAHPVAGAGAGAFRVEWLRERRIDEPVRDAHSIVFEMAAELGLVGLLALAALVGGVAACARIALRRHPAAAVGPAAATLAWLPHASIDWLWQLPAVALPALALAGGLVALAEPSGRDPVRA